MRTQEQTQILKKRENRIRHLEKKNAKLEEEMIQRGIEITKMIHIFLVCENLLPDGQKDEFRKVAVDYAARNDKRGSVYCRGKIDFRI